MSSLEEKEIEKEMQKTWDICIVGDKDGNNSHRYWCSDLPTDALLLIMSKVGGIDILMGAQWVCKNWRKVCSEVPSLWRNIDMTSFLVRDRGMLNRMARDAIDRAQGDVQEFKISYTGDNGLLRYQADITSLLRRLRRISGVGITGEELAECVGRFPLLEELDITVLGAYGGDNVFELIGTACPQLKFFRFNCVAHSPKGDEVAFDIANYMPNLRQLQIVGNKISTAGLTAILDKCVHLESLDHRCCFNVNIYEASALRAKCAHIKDLRLPNDPMDDLHPMAMMYYDDDDDDMFFDYHSDPYDIPYYLWRI